MYFFATGTITAPDRIGPHLDEETRVLDELRAQGTVKEAFRYTDKHGVIGIFEGADLDEVRKQIQRLPFVSLGFLTFEYTPVSEL